MLSLSAQKQIFWNLEPSRIKNTGHGKFFIPVCRRSEVLIKCQKRIYKLFDII